MKTKVRLLITAALLSGVCSVAVSAPKPVAVKRKAEFTDAPAPSGQPDTQIRPKAQGKAKYPASFKGSGIVGKATIAFIVGTDGVPTQVQYTQATDIAFAEAAIEAVKKWRFTPATKGGKPIPTTMMVPVEVRE